MVLICVVVTGLVSMDLLALIKKLTISGNVISTNHEVPILNIIYGCTCEGVMFNLVHVILLRVPWRLERGTSCVCGVLLEKTCG